MSRLRSGTHQIGEVADAVGLSLRTIRYYDEIGLAPPSGHTTGGFRLYTDADIERLRLIKHMKPLDFSLDEMRQLLEAQDALSSGATDEAARHDFRARLAMFAALADQRCTRLREQLEAAEHLADLLHRSAQS